MTTLVGVFILVLLGLLGSRVAFDPARTPLGPRLLLTTGTHFLLLGLLVGPILNLVTTEIIVQLEPFLALGLGWIGLMFGLQLDQRHLRLFPPSYLLFTILQAIATFGIFWGIGYAAVRLTPGLPPGADVAILAAASTAAVSTPAGVALISRTFRLQGKLARFLFYVSSLDALVGIVALQITYAVYHPSTLGPGTMGWALWLGAALANGIIFGVFFLWITRPKPEREELILFLVGVVIFQAGTALYLGVSPLFVAAVTGMVVGNLSPARRRVYSVLEAWEKPIYVILLILAGAMITWPTWLVLPIAAAYLLLRGAGKVIGGSVATRVVRLPFRAPAGAGLGLIPQGGISLAMAMSIVLTYGAAAGYHAAALDVMFTAIVIAVAASELIGPFLTRDLLRKVGEITPAAETALARDAD